MDLQLIKVRAEEIKFSGGIKALAEQVGMTVQNLHRCVRENKIQAQDLEQIARALGVPVGYFFDECEEPTTGRATALDHSAASINGNATVHVNTAPSTSTPADTEKIAHLEALLAEKERAIQDKERTIQILLNK